MASSKVETHSSFVSKRSRHDSRGDNDWACPKCRNLNYGFRDVCNRANCGTPRPPVISPTRISQYNSHSHPYYFGGSGSVPPMSLGFDGMYGPGAGGPLPYSRMHYDFNAHSIPRGAYGMIPAFPAGPGGGMGYCSGHPMGGYGYGFQVPTWTTGDIPDNNSTRKRRGVSGPDGGFNGDWVCPHCENVNFAFRDTCNIKKCGAPRPSNGPNRTDSGVPEGSWTCTKCNNLNYPYRSVCNRKGCDNKKPTSDSEQP